VLLLLSCTEVVFTCIALTPPLYLLDCARFVIDGNKVIIGKRDKQMMVDTVDFEVNEVRVHAQTP